MRSTIYYVLYLRLILSPSLLLCACFHVVRSASPAPPPPTHSTSIHRSSSLCVAALSSSSLSAPFPPFSAWTRRWMKVPLRCTSTPLRRPYPSAAQRTRRRTSPSSPPSPSTAASACGTPHVTQPAPTLLLAEALSAAPPPTPPRRHINDHLRGGLRCSNNSRSNSCTWTAATQVKTGAAMYCGMCPHPHPHQVMSVVLW